MDDIYIAHENELTQLVQSVSSHNMSTARLCRDICPLTELADIAWLAGMLHDCGKYSADFQDYIKAAIKAPGSVRRGSVTHSAAGGRVIERLAPRTVLAEVIQLAVYSHHGLHDSFSLNDGQCIIDKRGRSPSQADEEEAIQRFFTFTSAGELKDRIQAAMPVWKQIMCDTNDLAASGGKNKIYGTREFYLGMYERLLLSVLIHSDRLDTAIFSGSRQNYSKPGRAELLALWETCIDSLEQKLDEMRSRPQEQKSPLDGYRVLISDSCKMASYAAERLYRLTVPTGSGKTLSSLRFALYHARQRSLQRIVYVVSFNTILEQNASEIRKAVGNEELVLEHHCNVIHEDDEAQKRYQLLTESWESPIVVTSAVQLLNALFSSGTGNVRRMHCLCNSVIIFDEIQALPVKITKLFNLAVNFLTSFCNTTVVLCSATQPLLDQLPAERIMPLKEMAGDVSQYELAFRRSRIVDKTRDVGSGWGIEELCSFAGRLQDERNQILVIVNTKACAEAAYRRMKEEMDGRDVPVFHLSTNMCPENRRWVLKEIREILDQEKPIICVSTQLIEAGIDISFQCVIRSLAGLDNVIQAAGRCNRHGKHDRGEVYIVKMSGKTEDISRLTDIRIARESLEWLLEQYARAPENFGDDLSSQEAVKRYYEVYMGKRLLEMDYKIPAYGDTTILELLSSNEKKWYSFHEEDVRKQPILKQSFKTAGDYFEVIPEDSKVNVVVEYDDIARKQIDILQDAYSSLPERKKAIRKLQPYTVGISEGMKQKLGNAVRAVCQGCVYVLSSNYYDRQTGVSEYPSGMEFLGY